MKKILFILLAVSSAFTSCKDEELLSGGKPANAGELIQFGASQPQLEYSADASQDAEPGMSSRAHYGNLVEEENEDGTITKYYPVYWGSYDASGSIVPDEIAIFCPEADGESYMDRECTYVINTVTGSSGSLSVSEETDNVGLKWGYNYDLHNFYALYPASMKNNVTAGSNKVTCTLPILQAPVAITSEVGEDGHTTYTAQPNMEYAYMYAHGTGYKSKNDKISLEFNPIVTTLEITVNGPSVDGDVESLDVTQVMVRSSNSICGKFDITIAEKGSENDGLIAPVEDGTLSDVVNIPVYSEKDGGQVPVTLKKGDRLVVYAFLLPDTNLEAGTTTVTVNMRGNGSKTKIFEVADIQAHKINRTSLPALEPTDFYYWMSAIDENVYFSQLSIPGSHNCYGYPSDAKTVISGGTVTITPGTVKGEEKPMDYYQAYDAEGQMRKGARAFTLMVNVSGNVVHGETVVGTLFNVIQNVFMKTLKDCVDNDPYKNKRQNNEFIVLNIEFVQEGPDKEDDCHKWIKNVDEQISSIAANDIFVTNLSNTTTIKDLRNKIVLFVNYQGTTYPDGFDAENVNNYIILNDVYSDETDESLCNKTYYALNDRDITNIYRFVPTGSGFKGGNSVNIWKQCLQRLEPIDGISSIDGNQKVYDEDEVHWPTWFENSTPNRIETKKDKIVKMIQQAVLQYNDGTSGQWNINNLGGFCIVNDASSFRSKRGVAGNTVTAANVINEYTYNYLANDANRTGPLGVMQMNFFGMEQMTDANKGVLSTYGVSLPQIIIENNFRFPLKYNEDGNSGTTGTQRARSASSNGWDY